MDDNQTIDFWLLAVTMLLAGIGLVMVYSSSMYLSMDKFGTGTSYFKKQALNLAIGFIVMMFLIRLNYRGFAKFGNAFLIIGFVMLSVLLIQNHILGYSVNRWLKIGRISFQPSEVMKILLIIFLADSISRMGEKIRDFKKGFLPLIGVLIFTFILVFLEPDFGIAGLLLIIGLYVMFIGKAKLVHCDTVFCCNCTFSNTGFVYEKKMGGFYQSGNGLPDKTIDYQYRKRWFVWCRPGEQYPEILFSSRTSYRFCVFDICRGTRIYWYMLLAVFDFDVCDKRIENRTAGSGHVWISACIGSFNNVRNTGLCEY